MKRMIIQDQTLIPPFGEPARELRILNKPLWLLQRDLLSRYCKGGQEIASLHEIPDQSDEELFVYKDNLFFNQLLVDTFLSKARATGKACQIAFTNRDRAITTHALGLQSGIRPYESPLPRMPHDEGQPEPPLSHCYVADMYYYPPGPTNPPAPLIIDTEAREMGYYSVPRYMARQGDLVYQIPLRSFLSIENWVHLFLANIVMGTFSEASRAEYEMDRCSLRRFSKWKIEDWRLFGKKLKLVLGAFWERLNPFEAPWRNHFLASRSLVKVGKNCSIDPSAVIHGPTTIGDNVYIGPGTVITNSVIGSNANIMQGCQVMLSVVSDRSFLAFNSALFMSSMMENCMLAQNTCVQLGVIGRNTFIGANNVFTDFNLSDQEEKQSIRTYHRGKLVPTGLPVLGSAVGHNCKIGSGFVVYPGRMIGSNVTLTYHDREGLIRTNIPGGSPEDIDEETGEPRRVFYRWPNVYEPESAASYAGHCHDDDNAHHDTRPHDDYDDDYDDEISANYPDYYAHQRPGPGTGRRHSPGPGPGPATNHSNDGTALVEQHKTKHLSQPMNLYQ
ncbi:MAG: multidrug transporter [Chloroflexaceae bacterium]|nr:multidrug transporter [Chloroflexaceae bacterium]